MNESGGGLTRPATARPRRDPIADEPVPPDTAETRAIERQLTELAVIAGATVEEPPGLGARLVRWPGRGIGFNHGVEPRWTADDWPARARALADHLRGLGELPSIALLESAATPGLAGLLGRAGWLPVGRELVLWTRRAAVVPHLDPTLRVENVTPARIREYERVERSIFGLAPREAEDRLASLERGVASGRLRAYLVRLEGRPIATARLIPAPRLASSRASATAASAAGLPGAGGPAPSGPPTDASDPNVAALQGIGVVADLRRQGYGSLITTIATRAGLAMGHRLVWLACDPDDPAASTLYGGLDYRPLSEWRRLLLPA
jgi:Acetyltransferase (GNAT) family